jgi:hypothetical protein
MTAAGASPRWALCCAVLVIGAAAAARAQDASPAPAPPADRLAKAQSLILEADPKGAVFRVGDTGDVVHVQSGMTCPMGGPAMSLTKLFITAGRPPGDDVACDYVTPTGKTTIFATRLGAQTFSSATKGVFQAMRATFPGAKPAQGPMVATYSDLSAPVSGSLGVSQGGKDLITSVWMSQEHGWLVEVRATYPADSRHDPELLAAMSLVYAQKSVHEFPSDRP